MGLADLNTRSNYVQDRIGQYINYLRDLGVADVRANAAKLIDMFELAAIVGKMGGGLYRPREMISHAGETVTSEMRYHVADITEFNHPITLAADFQDAGSLQYMSTFDESGGPMPGDLRQAHRF